jgi:hypothetical protein
MKNLRDHLENRTHDFPACSAVPRPTALRRTPVKNIYMPTFHQGLQRSVNTGSTCKISQDIKVVTVYNRIRKYFHLTYVI